eukprot:1669416-Amphidinium_carterae.1
MIFDNLPPRQSTICMVAQHTDFGCLGVRNFAMEHPGHTKPVLGGSTGTYNKIFLARGINGKSSCLW